MPRLSSLLKNFKDSSIILTLLEGLSYSHQLLLLETIGPQNIPPSKMEAERISAMLKPLSPAKRIKILLSYDCREPQLEVLPILLKSKTYQRVVSRAARKNKVKHFEDLERIAYELNEVFFAPAFDYEGEWSVFKEMDKLRFEHQGEEYFVFLPKEAEDFFDAGQELHNCVSSYHSYHAKRTCFKFFIKKNKRFFCSAGIELNAEGDAQVDCFGVNNVSPSLSFISSLSHALEPWEAALTKTVTKRDAECEEIIDLILEQSL